MTACLDAAEVESKYKAMNASASLLALSIFFYDVRFTLASVVVLIIC